MAVFFVFLQIICNFSQNLPFFLLNLAFTPLNFTIIIFPSVLRVKFQTLPLGSCLSFTKKFWFESSPHNDQSCSIKSFICVDPSWFLPKKEVVHYFTVQGVNYTVQNSLASSHGLLVQSDFDRSPETQAKRTTN